MVYRKKRYNRRYKNKTKKFNKYAYAKTDSKNQSKQIVRLNKKIDNVYKALKPELLKVSSSGEFEISSAAPSVLNLKNFIGGDIVGYFKGNYAKYIYFNFKFFFNSANVDLTQGKTLRLVVFQNRIGKGEVPTAEDIFEIHTNSIISSFKDGINNNYKILLDKTYIISSDKDYLYRSYNFKKLIGYNLFTKTTSTNPTYPRGTIYIMFITTQETAFKIKWTSRLGYIDQAK